MTHICVSKLTINSIQFNRLFRHIGPNKLLNWIESLAQTMPWRRSGAIIWTNVVYWTPRNKLQWNLNWNSYNIIQEDPFENVIWKMAAILSRPQCVETKQHHHKPHLCRVWIYRWLTHCGLVMPYGDIDLVNIGLDNGLLPDGTKPLLEPLLTYHQCGSVMFIWGQFLKVPQPSTTKFSIKITFLKFH